MPSTSVKPSRMICPKRTDAARGGKAGWTSAWQSSCDSVSMFLQRMRHSLAASRSHSVEMPTRRSGLRCVRPVCLISRSTSAAVVGSASIGVTSASRAARSRLDSKFARSKIEPPEAASRPTISARFIR